MFVIKQAVKIIVSALRTTNRHSLSILYLHSQQVYNIYTFPLAVMIIMNQLFITICLLIFSNLFMTFAWYGHLRFLHNQVWIVAVFISWGIALFEYLLQVPANRIGFQVATAGQLKIIQEVISLSVFIPFSIYILKEPFKTDYIWAGFCLLGAVFFMFRDKIFA